MADIQFPNVPPVFGDDDDDDGERGKRGKRGKRGERGERGHAGPTGPTGPTGPASTPGSTGSTGSPGSGGSTGPTGPAAAGLPIIAAASVALGGTYVSSSGFVPGITHPGAGVYVLTLAAPPPDINIIVELTPVGAAFAVVASVVAGVITVNTADRAGTPSDFQFYITVTDNS